ncbi:MAG: hypothetical protein SFV18_08870 [Bryobacteraceae bacterium]|nr:hypothetical protein [Bryobacteraceae bacterium]
MLIVVGGNTRNIGKTTLVCEIVAALPTMNWTAMKITQFGHGRCADDGMACECAPSDPDHVYAIDEQTAPDGTDTGRYLAAGARRSFWIRCREGLLAEAMPRVRDILASAPNAIVESNSLMQFVRPDLYLTIVDRAGGDFKVSAQRFLTLADLAVAPRNRAQAVEFAVQRAAAKVNDTVTRPSGPPWISS